MDKATMHKDTTQKVIELWKKLEVTSVDFNFSCGGDSMNDTNIEIHTKNGVIQNDEIENYIDNEVYKNVSFYEASDGHYQGEFGVVEVTMETDEDEAYFVYNKSTTSEWSEQQSEVVTISLNKEEVEFIKENVLNINGDDSNLNFVYKDDVFLTDDKVNMLNELDKKISNTIRHYEVKCEEGELQDYYTFHTEENNLTINEYDELEVEVDFSVTIYRENDID